MQAAKRKQPVGRQNRPLLNFQRNTAFQCSSLFPLTEMFVPTRRGIGDSSSVPLLVVLSGGLCPGANMWHTQRSKDYAAASTSQQGIKKGAGGGDKAYIDD
ncbi:hypothetical protein NDU88_000726 [Pleurodeles waltl]|uniref:Uncharacterized protein n=1 Tax=Pleurodeles waltl TaxID=8319 RepID=A0AAV7KPP5_PLEWA|nr:hypothetical protein NDU88_000726 [Pleurodeles waltl]